ncbi:MAG TPA: hypothetical protein VHU15_06945 [Stellaceae bacterium]|nr:hypothetical protein [Stellaceae bacterium]
MPSAQFYRDRAAQIRRLIDGLRDVEMQDQLALIAKEYEDMAEMLDERAADDSARK